MSVTTELIPPDVRPANGSREQIYNFIRDEELAEKAGYKNSKEFFSIEIHSRSDSSARYVHQPAGERVRERGFASLTAFAEAHPTPRCMRWQERWVRTPPLECGWRGPPGSLSA